MAKFSVGISCELFGVGAPTAMKDKVAEDESADDDVNEFAIIMCDRRCDDAVRRGCRVVSPRGGYGQWSGIN